VYIIVDWLVDSGCAVTVACKLVEEYMQGAVQSSLWLNGFSTQSSERADLAGGLCMYVLSATDGTHGRSLLLDNVNTAANARLNLLSLTELFDEQGFDVAFRHHGFSGFEKVERGERIQLPIYHRPETHSWHMYTVLADSIDAAREAGLIVESVFTRLTDSTVRSALLFERHSTRVLQSLAGSVQLHQGEDCWNIDIGLINRVTGFDIQDQSS